MTVLVRILYILVGVLGWVRLNRCAVQSLRLRWVGGMKSRVAIIGRRRRSVLLERIVLLLVRVSLGDLLRR